MLRRWVAVASLLGAIGIVVALLFTPLLGVRGVSVSGLEGLTSDQVRTAAAIRPGTPMLRLDVAGIMARVATLPRVAAVDVSREWPDTVHIAVTERDPVGVLRRPDGVHLVDLTGLDYATVATAPAGLPEIQLVRVAPDDPRTRAVVAVLAALPPQLKSEVIAVGAPTPGGITLALAGGRTVRWGGPSDAARKSAVLAALMTQPGKIYDVSSPDLPTIS
jgi:cell division protein FtsQ